MMQPAYGGADRVIPSLRISVPTCCSEHLAQQAAEAELVVVMLSWVFSRGQWVTILKGPSAHRLETRAKRVFRCRILAYSQGTVFSWRVVGPVLS